MFTVRNAESLWQMNEKVEETSGAEGGGREGDGRRKEEERAEGKLTT